jgi:hypothetical protein
VPAIRAEYLLVQRGHLLAVGHRGRAKRARDTPRPGRPARADRSSAAAPVPGGRTARPPPSCRPPRAADRTWSAPPSRLGPRPDRRCRTPRLRRTAAAACSAQAASHDPPRVPRRQPGRLRSAGGSAGRQRPGRRNEPARPAPPARADVHHQGSAVHTSVRHPASNSQRSILARAPSEHRQQAVGSGSFRVGFARPAVDPHR